MTKVRVFGADWCPLTRRALAHLEQRNVPFDYIDVDKDKKASEWVKQQNDGKERKPTIVIGEQILSEPTNQEIDSALE